MEINIKDVIGTRCIIKEDGQKLYNAIHASLVKNDSVNLDFTGVGQFASQFFNVAIGQLLKDSKPEDISSLLHYKNLATAGQRIIECVIENARNYQANVDYQKIVDSILEEQGIECINMKLGEIDKIQKSILV